MKQLQTSAVTNLELIGIRREQQRAHPSRLTPVENYMPPRLNRRAIDVWKEALKEVESEPVSERAWSQAVSRFITLCTRRQINPFQSDLDRTDNNSISEKLKFARRQVVKYIDDWKVLERNDVAPAADYYTINKLPDGFEIHSRVSLRNVDLFEFKREIEARKFFKYDGPYKIGRWDWHRRIYQYPIWVGVSSAGNIETYLWYTIQITDEPFVNLIANNMASGRGGEFERTIESIWLPIVKNLRFWTLNRSSRF